MKLIATIAAGFGLILTVSATSADAVSNGLRNHKEINNRIAVFGIADEIRKNCDTIEPRMVRAYVFGKATVDKAKADGYSDEEIEAFAENKEDRARLKAAVQKYLTSKGAKADDPQSYCAVGLAEIDRNSQIGALLRSK